MDSLENIWRHKKEQMEVDINVKSERVWDWKKFRFQTNKTFEVVKVKHKREWVDPTYGNGGGDFIKVERKTVLKVFNDYLDALDYMYYIKKIHNGKV